ncbi:MAG TPA: NepR family anti-sigma factor [Sphingomonas sp.]|jgi:hypothetical protein|nr:NepR family anti-sigma factor [Sphingomonas sp.]
MKTAVPGAAPGEVDKSAALGGKRATGPAARAGATRIQGKDRDMGSALRSVYQQTVDEVVPDDLLDLLGKLG